jgi:hypothetical protein
VTSYDDLVAAEKERANSPGEPPAGQTDPATPTAPAPTPDPEPPVPTPTPEGELTPPVPTPEPESDTPPTAAVDKAAAANALQDPAVIDPQLKQAIERLEEEIQRRAASPRRA